MKKEEKKEEKNKKLGRNQEGKAAKSAMKVVTMIENNFPTIEGMKGWQDEFAKSKRSKQLPRRTNAKVALEDKRQRFSVTDKIAIIYIFNKKKIDYYRKGFKSIAFEVYICRVNVCKLWQLFLNLDLREEYSRYSHGIPYVEKLMKETIIYLQVESQVSSRTYEKWDLEKLIEVGKNEYNAGLKKTFVKDVNIYDSHVNRIKQMVAVFVNADWNLTRRQIINHYFKSVEIPVPTAAETKRIAKRCGLKYRKPSSDSNLSITNMVKWKDEFQGYDRSNGEILFDSINQDYVLGAVFI